MDENNKLQKPATYSEVVAKQPEGDVLAEDINQIIANLEIIKGGSSRELPVTNLKELDEKVKIIIKYIQDGGGELPGEDNNTGVDKDRYTLEKSEIIIQGETARDQCTKSLDNLLLKKNEDGTYTYKLEGSIELASQGMAIFRTTEDTNIHKANAHSVVLSIVGMVYQPIYVFLINKRIYFVTSFEKISSLNQDINVANVTENKIIFTDKNFCLISGFKNISDDLAIHYENSNYRLKGSFSLKATATQQAMPVNYNMRDFFDAQTYNFNGFTGEFVFESELSNRLILKGSFNANTTYNIDLQCPKQPEGYPK